MDADNPFQSPLVMPAGDADALSVNALSVNELRFVMRRWERLRILYNALVGLVGIGVLMELPPQFLGFETLAEVVLYGLLANICYFAGPAIEWYLLFLGFRWRSATALLFSAGLLFSLCVTLIGGGAAVWTVKAIQ